MRVLKVNTKPSYEILIKENLLEEIPEDVKKILILEKSPLLRITKLNLFLEKNF